MSDWGDAFNRALARGEDHGAAAMIADDADARKKRKFLRRLWNASLLLEIAAAGCGDVEEAQCLDAMLAVREAHARLKGTA